MCQRRSGFSLTEVKACAINRTPQLQQDRSVRACFITEGGCNSTADRRTGAPDSSFVWERLRVASKHMLQHKKSPFPSRCSPLTFLPTLSRCGWKSLRAFGLFVCLGGFSFLKWGNEMRVPTRPPSLIHRLMAGRGGSPLPVPGCVRACTLHKIPLRKFRKRTTVT